MNYRLINNIAGWVAFLVAAVVYISTIEPTTSFWDCGEFIATAYKLEVGHPPGAPFFMILARVFSLFSFGDVTSVAKMVNILSALASAFTILFLFWSITHLARKIVNKAELAIGDIVGVIGAGMVGALAYTFSDTFWFSAVEGEVYALSSLFTAVVFWAILKWESVADEPYSNRWIVLIAFLMGISIGVHLLNLLAIPALVFVYFFKKHTVNLKGIIMAALVAVVLLGAIMYGIIPGVVTSAAWFELRFVNDFGMGYNSGIIVYAILLLGSIIACLYFSSRRDKPFVPVTAATFIIAVTLLGIPFMGGGWLFLPLFAGVVAVGIYLAMKRKEIINTIVLAITVIIIGYSSFTMIVIRSFADPPMDENNPENVFALLSYLNREQYGDRPLVYGQFFNSPLDSRERYTEGDPVYIQRDGKYVVADTRDKPNYDSDFTAVFPRMYSPQGQHVDAYLSWIGKSEKDFYFPKTDAEGNAVTDADGFVVYDRNKPKRKPTMGENLKFFFSYQVGHMYFRYFMWNFAGRQNDIQGHGDKFRGNWVSGIPFVDNRLGDQEDLPNSFKKNNARNHYYLLPLLLGILGLAFQFSRGSRDFLVVTLLFVLTGLAIVVYLNQYPYQPRERDYAYAGSFYAFAIWIGLGVMAISNFFGKFIKGVAGPAVATAATLVLVPGIMASENWDDHDRSDRYIARDFAKNYLESCAPNAILITYGDNDTFPLWYAQEVEGIRTDVRVLCFTLFNTDWYVDQMARKAYDSDALNFSMGHDKYVQGSRDIVYIMEDKRLTDAVDLKQAIEFVASDDVRTKLPTQSSENLDYLPTRTLRLKVDKEKVLANGTVKQKDADKILPYLDLKINKSTSFLQKNELMLLDFLAHNNWERPVYFTSMGDVAVSFRDYLQLEGFAYRFVPISTRSNMGELGRIDSDVLYDNMVNKFNWGNLNKEGVYLDQTILRTTNIVRIRNTFARLGEQLLKENKLDSAKVVFDKAIEVMPNDIIPYDVHSVDILNGYYILADKYKARGESAKAEEVLNVASDMTKVIYDETMQEMDFLMNLPLGQRGSVDYERRGGVRILQELSRLTKENNHELSQQTDSSFKEIYVKFLEQEGY